MASSPHNAQADLEPPGPSGNQQEVRMVLLGKTGTGKSSSGNTVLGRGAFRADISPASVTCQCERHSAEMEGKTLVVVDTPGFFDTRLSPGELMAEVGRSIVLSAPGPHVFLVVLQPGRFTQEEQHTMDWIEATFGKCASQYTMVLFTWGDQLKGKAIEDFLKESKELSDFVHRCQGGYHVFDNTIHSSDRTQVIELLDKIYKLVEENRRSYYSSPMYQEAEKAIQEIQQRILGLSLGEGEDVGEVNLQCQDVERKQRIEEERKRKEEEEARRRAEKLFWCELLTAVGKGAVEGAGLMEK
uniref:AIG1-type G domain-containing protein n=2 Tax=Denticeps clupeoides TaxID=299321 RepID=A0AAY4D4U3_9TELE